MQSLSRVVFALLLFAIAAYSVFGFLASREPGISLAWRIGWGMTFVLAMAGGIALLATSQKTV